MEPEAIEEASAEASREVAQEAEETAEVATEKVVVEGPGEVEVKLIAAARRHQGLTYDVLTAVAMATATVQREVTKLAANGEARRLVTPEAARWGMNRTARP